MSSTPVAPVFAEEPSAPDAVAPSEDAVELGDEAPEPVGPEEVPLSQVDEATDLEGEPQDDQTPEDVAVEDAAAGKAQEPTQPSEKATKDESAADDATSAASGERVLTAQASDDMVDELDKLYKMVNQLRLRNGLSSLTYDYELEDAAKVRAREIGTSFSHTRPNGQSFRTAIPSAFTMCGENIVMYKKDAKEAFDRWDGSKDHHDNMLGEYYNVVAIGFARVNGVTYWAMELAYRSQPALMGASRIPIDAKATYKLKSGCTLRLMKNGKKVADDGIVSVSGSTVTGKKAGTTTLYEFDAKGKEVGRKTLTVYALSGSWELQSPIDSNYVLDIKYRSKANTARMIVWKRNNQTNQRYQFERMGDGSYLIKCVHSGKFVDVQYGGTAKQQPVIQWTRNARTNQRWLLTVDVRDHVTFVCKRSNMCFDIQYGKVANGSAMIQWPNNGKSNQKWVLNKK